MDLTIKLDTEDMEDKVDMDMEVGTKGEGGLDEALIFSSQQTKESVIYTKLGQNEKFELDLV